MITVSNICHDNNLTPIITSFSQMIRSLQQTIIMQTINITKSICYSMQVNNK